MVVACLYVELNFLIIDAYVKLIAIFASNYLKRIQFAHFVANISIFFSLKKNQ